jgi:hypothetical protein
MKNGCLQPEPPTEGDSAPSARSAPTKGGGSVQSGGSSTASAAASEKSVQAGEQDLQRDDGYEGNHNEGHRRSIKPLSIGVATHRTALLFGTKKQICRGLPPFNSEPAMREAQQHFGCAALARNMSIRLL